MLFAFRNLFTEYHSDQVPDPANGGGAGAAQGTAPQGQGQPPQGGAGFRQHFPDVPDEHWQLIEPHVGQIEAHTTQLQQQLAPFKELVEAGYQPQHLQGLVAFDQRFNQNPLEVWIELGNRLQQSQNGRPPAVSPDVDLEYLAALARGEDPDAGSVPGSPAQGAPGADPQGDQNPYVQQLEGQVQQLGQQVQTLMSELQQDRTQRQTMVQDTLYERRIGQMREALKQGGWPEELLTDESLASSVIAHRGNFANATKSLLDQRSNLLKGFAGQRQQQPGPTDLPNGAPPSTPREERPREKGDSWSKGRRNAEARLKRLNTPG